MKKLIALSLVTLMAVGAIAQDASKLQFGLRGGVNLTEMTLKHSDFDTENRMGFFVGPTVKLALPVVGLGLDLSALYNYRESKLEGETVKQHSLDIPLNVRYSLGMGGVANVFVAAGPQVAFNLGDREVDLDMVNDWRFRDSFFSFNVGGGLTLINTLELSARYNIPIGNTNDVTWSDASDKVFHAKTNNWQVGLTYYF